MATKLNRGEHYHNTTTEALFGANPSTKQQEWLDAKASRPNSILLVHVGKFYEVFHQDADVMNEHFESPYMKGQIAHTGFPETALEKFKGGLETKNYEVILL